MIYTLSRAGNNIALLLFLFLTLTWSCQSIIVDVDLDEMEEGEEFSMKKLVYLDEWVRMQGGAVYGDYLVCLTAMDWGEVPNGYIYNLFTGSVVCKMTFTSVLNGKKYYMPHANQVSFGTSFYNDESDFPLLYVSQVNGGSGNNDIRGERGVLVYNLRRTGSGYTPELVQVIIPDLNDEVLMAKLGKYTPNYIVDTDHNQFVIIGYPNNSWYNLIGPQPITIMNVPSINEEEVIFKDNDIIDSYQLPQTINPQQSFYYQGKVFSSGGDAHKASIRVINLISKRVDYFQDMSDVTDGEPQFLGLWKGILLYYEYGYIGQIYEIFLPGYRFHN